ncbi:MAG: hypothetical protein ACHQT7_00365 [Candidatus Levyibacteriota bacterium]
MSIKKRILFALIPLAYLLLLLSQIDLSMLGDLGRHLKVGEVVVHCFCVPQTNLFSYTNPAFPVVNHEWFAEVIFYLTSAWFGLRGLLVLKMLFIVTSAALLYFVASKKGSIFWVTIFSITAITIFSMRFFVLPELFSYVFISLFIFFLERYKETKKTYWLWLLPFIELLWVNSHIYFILGIGIYGFFLLEEWVRRKKIEGRLLYTGIILIFSTLGNPSFIRGALLPFTFSTNYNFPVEENISPFKIFAATSTNGNMAYTLVLQVMVFELLLVLFFLCFFLKKQWGKPFHLGNGAMGAVLGMMFVRCISLFGLLGFIPLVQSFTCVENRIKNGIDKSTMFMIKGVTIIVVSIIVGIHIKGLFDYKILGFGFVPSAENAVTFMEKTHIHGRIFNNYIIGNYLIYKLYPKEQVYIDARPEAYPASFFNDYWRMLSDEQFFNQQVGKYNINAVAFNVIADDPVKIRPFLLRLLRSTDWVPVYSDGTVTIIVRNNATNKDVIEKYKITIQK